MAESASEKFWDMLGDFTNCMVVTRDGGMLRGRPMAVRLSDDRRHIMFLSDRNTHKVEEIERDPDVALSFSRHGEWISVSGRARVSGDRALVDQAWGRDAEAWLPQGKDDPSVIVLVVEPHRAELWDVEASKLTQAWEFAKAYTGNQARPETGDHRQVDL